MANLYTRIDGVKVRVERHGIMILLTALDGSRRWRVTKQFGLEEIPVFNDER